MPARAYAYPQSDRGEPLRVGPTPNVAVCAPHRVYGTYGGQGKAAGFLDGFAANPQITTRRFPPPWSVEELEACFVVRDHNGQQLAYVYFEDEPGRRSAATSPPISPNSLTCCAKVSPR
jgi:hypothetical protein